MTIRKLFIIILINLQSVIFAQNSAIPDIVEVLPQSLAWDHNNLQRIDLFLQGRKDGGLAIFDADGTLWADDVGEAFFRWLIAEKKLLNVDYSTDLWDKYEKLLDADKNYAYEWVDQIMAGLNHADVKVWMREFFKENFVSRIYQPQKELIRKLRVNNFDVWIVSASNIDLVKAGAPYVGVDPNNVIGYDLEIENGILTDRLKKPIPYREGKLAAIKKIIKRQPDLVAGDSRGDKEMLEYSKGIGVYLIHNQSDNGEMFTFAKDNKFIIQYFPLMQRWEPSWTLQEVVK
jgi:HAD superfamily phosphoserine phosphatase-like hydrolase